MPQRDDFTLDTVTSIGDEPREGSRRLSLLVIADDLVASHALPPVGEVTIGRSRDCQVQIDHSSISRQHARIAVASAVTITDLGSANGTRVRDLRIDRDTPVGIAPGDAIKVGSVVLLLQERAAPARTWRMWSHGYFEARVDEECARAARVGASFAILRLIFDPDATLRATEDTLGAIVRVSDVVGSFAPGDYEILMVKSTTVEAEQAVERIATTLAAHEVTVKIGLAMYPRDGRSADVLIAASGAAARGERTVEGAAGPIVVANEAMQRLHKLAEQVAASTISVLILGETGAGKEVIADRVHRLSPRAERPFLRLNCAALSESLIESELFGHERGAFTGAMQTKAGLLETADTGTVFLDEIGELPLALQVKLLRVIEERQVMRVGALKPRTIDVRFISATHRDLEGQITRGAFRQDLYYRLDGVTLVIPPLRERVDEIERLSGSFLVQAAMAQGQSRPPRLSAEALALLRDYTWPGNVRELRHVVERAVLLCGNGEITAQHLPVDKMRSTFATRPLATPVASTNLGGEKERILAALERCAGNQSQAARELGISRGTLVSRLDAYGVPRPRKGRGPL